MLQNFMTDDQNSQKISVDFLDGVTLRAESPSIFLDTLLLAGYDAVNRVARTIYSTVDDFTVICMRN